MTDFAGLLLPDDGRPARSIVTLDTTGFEAWRAAAGERARTAAVAGGFTAKPGTMLVVPGDAPDEWSVVVGGAGKLAADRWALADTAARLPAGTYRLVGGAPGLAAHGWLMAQHRFDRYRNTTDVAGARVLLSDDAGGIDDAVALAEATALVRDMVDTPAHDMIPAALADAIVAEGVRFGATVTVVTGEALRDGFPAVHAVGRAAAVQPRLIDLVWGDPAHPRLTLVGKGVTFDSGGLDIKPASGMMWMKKDMGGAAHALALARLVMGERLPVRLRLIVPAVENAISGNAFRPGDVLRTRKGISVEIGNTDAEGRLILADALTLAQEDAPDLLLDFATLTGAARVALGPDLPALFTHDDALADEFAAAARSSGDAVWRLPLWTPYADMLKSGIADINNSAEGGFAGAITAALFLDRFVDAATRWAHLDLFAWMPAAKPGRPKGGAATGLATTWELVRGRFRTKR